MRHAISCALRETISQHLDALTLRDEPAPSLPLIIVVGLLALHLAGLAAVWRYFHQPIWFALPSLALLLVLPLVTWRAQRGLPSFAIAQDKHRAAPTAVETLAPLFFLYVILLARYIAIRVVRADVPYQDESTLADVRLLAFQIELAVIAALVYTALVQVSCLMPQVSRERILVGLASALSVAACAWFAVETIGHRTRGVTGSDPYAYAQMAVDLATRGTPLHRFPLFASVAPLEVTWYPIVHVGYELPINPSGDAVTVWPPGGSVWLALAYRVFGEEGLYLATPLAALASLLTFALLAWEYFRDQPCIARTAIVGIAVALLATSWEQVDRSIIPLVDVQAQLFTVLAVWFVLKGTRSEHFAVFGFFAGFALGVAYFVRHTQALLVPALVIAAWQMPQRTRLQFLVAAALGAFVVALPDLWYHHAYFSGWLTPESALIFVSATGQQQCGIMSTWQFQPCHFWWLTKGGRPKRRS